MYTVTLLLHNEDATLVLQREINSYKVAVLWIFFLTAISSKAFSNNFAIFNKSFMHAYVLTLLFYNKEAILPL